MKRIRLLLAGIGSVLLAAGYLASQSKYMNDQAPQYAQQVDRTPIVLLSLVLFLGAVGLLFVPDPEEPQD